MFFKIFKMHKLTTIGLLICLIYCSSCSVIKQSSGQIALSDSNHLKFLDEYDVPFNAQFHNTIIGGLSGIDYNPQDKHYYLISDDRSAKNPARFYVARIVLGENKIDSVVFTGVRFLKDSTGKDYPNSHTDPYHTPDPEALRYDAKTNTFVWSSEGERIVRPGKIVLEDPAITEITPEGKYVDTFELPSQLHMHADESGPRQNSVFEGVTFDDQHKNLFVSVEEPLYNDGPRAGIDDSTGLNRILKFDMITKKPVAQYAYITDPVAYAPTPSNGFKINGISDILFLGNNKLLVIERSFSMGRMACTIRICIADLSQAENINDVASLKSKLELHTATKKLLLNMDDIGIYIDNIEGVTFGPKLADGKQSLIFVSDNNFNPLQKTQFLLFEIE